MIRVAHRLRIDPVVEPQTVPLQQFLSRYHLHGLVLFNATKFEWRRKPVHLATGHMAFSLESIHEAWFSNQNQHQ